MTSCSGLCCVAPSVAPSLTSKSSDCGVPMIFLPRRTPIRRSSRGWGGVKASVVDSSESSSDFVKCMEQGWLISQQPRPIACSSCYSNGHVECKWCGGTGFFILGDNMLCQVPSRNTTCVICAGKARHAAPIAKEQDFVPSGWGSLRLLGSDMLLAR